MEQAKDPKIQLIQDVLQFRGFSVEDLGNRIRILLDEAGFVGGVVDIYVLKNNPEEIRARMVRQKAADAVQLGSIKDIHHFLQDGLLGAASLEEFHDFGKRGNDYVYYAHVVLEEDPTDVIQQQIFAERALADLRGVDAKTFRKSLDQLGLSRSGRVRLALTRIFRDANSASDLVAVTAKEASLIQAEDDMECIRTLREKDAFPYLENLIHLLWDELAKRTR